MSERSEFLDFMGWDINIFGRHRLRIDDVETLAKDLSDRFDINIEYGYHHDYEADLRNRYVRLRDDSEWVSLGKIIRHSDQILYKLTDESYEFKLIKSQFGDSSDGIRVEGEDVGLGTLADCVRFEFEKIDDNFECALSFGMIYRDALTLIFQDDPGRWFGFHKYFTSDRCRFDIKYLNDFRRRVKRYFKAVGCDKVYYAPDQGDPLNIETYLEEPWDVLERYILSKGFCYSGAQSDLIDVPAFMKTENPIPSSNRIDIFVDDFSDLE